MPAPIVPDLIPDEALRTIHRGVVEDASQIDLVLKRLARDGTCLRGGIARSSSAITSHILAVLPDSLHLQLVGTSVREGRQMPFSFECDGVRYFFVSRVLRSEAAQIVEVRKPRCLYVAEQREFPRLPPTAVRGAPTQVQIAVGDSLFTGRVADWTYHGLGIEAPAAPPRLNGQVRVRALDGRDQGAESYASVRYVGAARAEGWKKLGLEVSRVERRSEIHWLQLEEIPKALPGLSGSGTYVRQDARERVSSPVEFRNGRGELVRGLIDSWGSTRLATRVVVPSAWGRTKETLLPLSMSIVETFRRAGLPIWVLRFDGTRRRGGSYIPSEFRHPGAEYLGFTFSDAVLDTKAAIDFASRHGSSPTVLITFSLASVEGRRVVAEDQGEKLAGWISVVGVADLQSTLHTVSGGVDFGAGLVQGVRFGRQELFGVVVDIDLAGLDAINSGLSFLEDARRDMAKIVVPVTWYHGKYDAWVDRERIRELMQSGDGSRRKLIELPIGHQLRTSEDALHAFGLVASEVASIANGVSIPGAAPALDALKRGLQRERPRRARGHVQAMRPFWKEYLVGERGNVGMELLTATSGYKEFMAAQVALLQVGQGDQILDLGAGTGGLSSTLHTNGAEGVQVDAVDFVREALSIAVGRPRNGVSVRPLVADLNQCGQVGLPLAAGSYDAALASLLVSYLDSPEDLLREVGRVLRPGGILVVSSLRRDADISKLYADAMMERYSDESGDMFGPGAEGTIDRSLPRFLNAASRILELEEAGKFKFFSEEELTDLLLTTGFVDVRICAALGSPPQALIASGSWP